MNLREITVPVGGAFVWTAAVMCRLWSVPSTDWIARDDAVITLSHARNAADFGSVGVSPGDRVEAFSSPLHFAVAFIIDLVSSPGYEALSLVILVAASVTTGALLSRLFLTLTLAGGTPEGPARWAAVGLTLAAGALTASSWTAVGWIGSGMENPLVLFAGVAVASISIAPPHRSSQGALVAALVLFALSRVEFAALTVPVVIIAAWTETNGRTDPARRAMTTAVAAFTLIAAIHVGRRIYFGNWLPNTSLVQGRSTGSTQLLLLAGVAVLLLLLFARAFLAGEQSTKRFGPIDPGDLLIIAAVVAGLVGLLLFTGRSEGSARDLASFVPVAVLTAALVATVALYQWRSDRPWPYTYLFASLAAVPLVQYLAMGPARLDGFRVASVAVPFLAIWGLAVLATAMRRILASAPTAIAVLTVLVVGGGVMFSQDDQRHLNFEVTIAGDVAEVAASIRFEHLNGGRPIVANPDLGKVSFTKDALIVDLGLLGDPMMARLASDRPDLINSYLALVARPDVVEVHGFWACQFGGWLNSDNFGDTYSLSDDRWLDGAAQTEGCFHDGRFGIWVRSDASAEYSLTRDLITDPASAGLLVERAYNACSSARGDMFRCQWVRRSAYRSAEQLKSSGHFESVLRAADLASPTPLLDRPLLERGPGWADQAFAAFIEPFAAPPPS